MCAVQASQSRAGECNMRRVAETDVYRASASVFVVQLIAMGACITLAVLGVRQHKLWFAGVWTLLLVYNVILILRQPFEVSVASDGTLTFRSFVRRRVVRVEDIRQIRRTSSEGGVWLKFTLTRGSVKMARCRRFDALVARLKENHPRLK
jgi:hypothetical protein